MDAFNEGGVDGAVDYVTPDFEMHSAPGWPGKQLYVGYDGARELAAEWMESFDEYQWVPGRIEEMPGDRVTALFRHRGRTRDGVPIDAPLAGVFEVTDGLITKVKWFFTWEEALEATRDEEEVQ
jgi:ketosteroid isomerase-like protein